MTVVDVEYQFDRHKITIYYDSPLRIDFRELVRDLFSSFKVSRPTCSTTPSPSVTLGFPLLLRRLVFG